MQGKRLSYDGLSLFYTGNDIGHFRVGISVGRKLAKATGRNRLRRRIRNCVMQALTSEEKGYDLVFVARRELSSADFSRVKKSVEGVLARTILRRRKSEGSPT